MFPKIHLAAVALTCMIGSAPAVAGGLAQLVEEPTVQPPVVSRAWDYSYVGLSASTGSGETLAPFGLPDQPLTLGANDHEFEGQTFGLIAGRMWGQGLFGYGVDAGLAWSNMSGDDGDQTTVVNGTDITAQGHIAGRVGLGSERLMVYGSAGLGMLLWEQIEAQDLGNSLSNSNTLFGAGPRLAIGVEGRLGNGIVRLETSQTRIGQEVGFHPSSSQSIAYDMGAEPTINEVTIAYGLRF